MDREGEDQVRLLLVRTIQELVKKKKIPVDTIDVEDARESLGLWKGMLIPPDRAGHRTNPYMPLVYGQFEKNVRPVTPTHLMTWCQRQLNCLPRTGNCIGYGASEWITSSLMSIRM